MSGRMVVGALLASVVMMVWGYLFWGMLVKPVDELPNEAAVQAVLADVPATGVYYLPGMYEGDDEAKMARYTARHEAGPLAMVFVNKSGAPVMSPVVFAKGFAHYIVISLLLGVLMSAFKVPSGGSRLGFSVLVGALAAVAFCFSPPIWWYHPWQYWLQNAAYGVGMFTLSGLVMGRFVKI